MHLVGFIIRTGFEVDATQWRAGWEPSGALCAPKINFFSFPMNPLFIFTIRTCSPLLPPPTLHSYLKCLEYVASWRYVMIYYLRRVSKQVTFPRCSARSNVSHSNFSSNTSCLYFRQVICYVLNRTHDLYSVMLPLILVLKTKRSGRCLFITSNYTAQHTRFPTEVESRFKNLWTGTTVCFKIKFLIVTVHSFIPEGQKF